MVQLVLARQSRRPAELASLADRLLFDHFISKIASRYCARRFGSRLIAMSNVPAIRQFLAAQDAIGMANGAAKISILLGSGANRRSIARHRIVVLAESISASAKGEAIAVSALRHAPPLKQPSTSELWRQIEIICAVLFPRLTFFLKGDNMALNVCETRRQNRPRRCRSR